MTKFLVGREQSSLRYAVLAERNSKDVGEGIKSLWEAWNRLRRSVRWLRKVKGSVVALEVTYNRKKHTWHPHLNVLMEGEYFPFEELRQSWSEATKHRGRTSFIRAADAGTVEELIKYVTKVADLIGNPDALEALLLSAHKKRFVRTYGSFYRLSVADEGTLGAKPKCCPDCDSDEIVALGRVDRWAEQLLLDLKGVFRVIAPRARSQVMSDQREAVSFTGLFLQHKYAKREPFSRDRAVALRDRELESQHRDRVKFFSIKTDVRSHGDDFPWHKIFTTLRQPAA
jgi:hypothetical protein